MRLNVEQRHQVQLNTWIWKQLSNHIEQENPTQHKDKAVKSNSKKVGKTKAISYLQDC